MSASIKGRTVIWSITAGVITAANAAATSGIVENFNVQKGGETAEIGDEDNDLVTRIGHAAKNTVTFDVLAENDSVLPDKEDEITGMGTIDGVDFSTGRVFVDSASAVYTKGQVKKLNVTCTHYPDMPVDG